MLVVRRLHLGKMYSYHNFALIFRDHIRQISKMLVNIHAMEMAANLPHWLDMDTSLDSGALEEICGQVKDQLNIWGITKTNEAVTSDNFNTPGDNYRMIYM